MPTQAANGDTPVVGRRWSIEHAFIGRPDHLPRLKALGVRWRSRTMHSPDRASCATGGRPRRPDDACADDLDAGLPVSSGTDAPVVPYPPLWTLYHFVTRDTITGGVLGPDQRVTREEALRMATRGNAWLMMEEADKGSLEAGKLADLVVLSEDPLTCPEPRLRDARVLMTIVGGRVVHESTW